MTEMPVLRLHNSLSGEKEIFTPADPNHVRVYACGPTVYSFAHIGNARMAVAFDLLNRVLRHLYPRVTYVSNITDVDDKIITASKETGEAIDVITRRYEKIYNDDMAALGVLQPDVQPRATEHIPEMIKQIEQIIERGHGYAADGHALFNVPSYDAYGALSGRSRDDQIAGARVEIAPYKKDAADFVLWKPSTPDQPGWDSPWGRGRPGWHIECSAMAEKHLGLPFDIHGGGADLKFPHHENEIAQSCCAHGHETDPRAFARMWVHNGFVTVAGEKMSKSLGNFLVAHELLQDHPGEVLRLALLAAHYRQPLDWTENGLHQARKNLDTLYRALDNLSGVPDGDAVVHHGVMAALCDDLNMPLALAALLALAKDANRTDLNESEKIEIKAALKGTGALLGLLQQDPQTWFQGGAANDDDAEIDALLKERTEARKNKDFKRADEIRDLFAAKGIEIEDTPTGPKWRRAVK